MSGVNDKERPANGAPPADDAQRADSAMAAPNEIQGSEERRTAGHQVRESPLEGRAAVPEPVVNVAAADAPRTQSGTVKPAVQAASQPQRAPRSVFIARFIQAIWLGSGVFLALTAAAVFKVLPPTEAADAVGAMVARWHYIALLAPVILILIEWQRSRSRMVILLFLAVLIAALQIGANLRIRRMRLESLVPISSLDRSDPVRRRFGALHGFSSLMLLAQIAAAIGVIAAEPDPDQ